jgi:endo-1,4-beta-mannosidase
LNQKRGIRISLRVIAQPPSGVAGAMLWCFADYHPSLHNTPPCLESKHERYFGMVRADGSLKPHAKVIQEFSEKNPIIQKKKNTNILESVTADEYYSNPEHYCKLWYEKYCSEITKVKNEEKN